MTGTTLSSDSVSLYKATIIDKHYSLYWLKNFDRNRLLSISGKATSVQNSSEGDSWELPIKHRCGRAEVPGGPGILTQLYRQSF